MGEKKYEVVAMDGHFAEFDNPEMPYLHYQNMSWDDAVSLCRLSFDQGFECVLWRSEHGEGDTGISDD